MKRLICRLRRHPVPEDGDTIATCPCGAHVHVHVSSDPATADVLRIRAANETDPALAAVLTATADWIEEEVCE